MFGGKMRTKGFVKNFLLVIFGIILLLVGSSETKADPAWSPEIFLPNDSVVLTCSNDSICFEVTGSDPDTNDIVSILLLEGPVVFDSIGGHSPVSANVCFLPDTVGDYRFIWEVRDLWGKYVIDTVTFTVDYGSAPSISDQSFSATQCDLKEARLLYLQLDIAAIGSVNWEIISGPGEINPLSGTITYTPDTTGVFYWLVAVSNWCGADTALITDTVALNNPPQVFCDDRTLHLCAPEQICFDVFGDDPDGDSIEIRMVQGIGNFNMTTDSSGVACFDPAAVDSADYFFVFRVADSCMSFAKEPANDCPCVDTVKVTVVINRKPELACPDIINIPACSTDSLYCFDISASDPDSDQLTYDVLSGNATIEGQTICLDPSTSGSFNIEVSVTDSCGASDTCIIPVEIGSNDPPVASLGDDFEIFLCAPEQLCISGMAWDPDGNLQSAIANTGLFSQANGQLCFTPDTAGIYELILTVTDSCGASDADTAYVAVQFNDVPVVVAGDDFTFDICGNREICFPVTVTDDNLAYVHSSAGAYNSQTGEVCFWADSAGVYTVVVQAGDGCDQTGSDTTVVTVTEQAGTTVSLGNDTSLVLCQTEEICFDFTIDGSYQSINSNLGTIDEANHRLCFTPELGGNYTFVLSIVDGCGVTVADTINASLELRHEPVITDLNDTTVYLCYPQYVCLPFTVFDVDGDIVSIVTSNGYIQDGEICFQGRKSGLTEVILTVTDSCGNTAVDTALIEIRTDQGVQLDLPNDTVIFYCAPETLCFPVGQIPGDADVIVNGINTWYNPESGQVCYYSDCGTTNHISMSVTTECGVYTDSFTVTSVCNSAPLVILPADTAIRTCEIAEVCLPVGISDVDGNVAQVEVVGATYDPVFGQVCFTPDTSGMYIITVTVTDECGATDFDQIIVAVYANQPPVCDLPGDTALWMCAPDTIRLPVAASDFDGNFQLCEVVSGPGSIVENEWVYLPETAGQFVVTVRCLDDCGAECIGNFTVTVDMNEAPACDPEIDTTIALCQPEQICLPIGASDPENGQITSTIFDGPGTIIDGFWCYTPSDDTSLSVTIRHTDSCGDYCDQTISLSVDIANDGYVLDCPNDTSLFVCDLSEICMPGFSVPTGADIVDVQVIGGTLRGDTICFTPVHGDNRIGYIIYDNCDHSDSCFTNVLVELNSAPVCVVPIDTTISVCLPAQICLPISATDGDGNLVGCELVSGPGTIQDNFWCYDPVDNESVTVTVRCTDDCGAYCEESFTVTIEAGLGPIAADSSYYNSYCFGGEQRQVSVIASDPNGGTLNYTLLTGPGSIDEFGIITYTVDTAGTYTFQVEVANSCGSDTVTIVDMIDVDSPPSVEGFDSTVYLCAPEEICFDISATDPDGDQLSIQQSSGIGTYTPGEGNYGTTCFIPADVDSAEYTFVYCADDGCYGDGKSPISTCDSVTITVVINRLPQITCPDPIFATICGVDTICFDVEVFDPDGDTPSLSVLSGNATLDGSTICIIADDNMNTEIVIEAADECGADTCIVPVTVTGNTAPEVVTAPDTSLTICDPQEVCIDVQVADIEGDLVEISTNIGTYDANSGVVCFVAEGSGEQMVIVTAMDSCGLFDADTTIVTVGTFESPTVSMPEDFIVTLCADSQVCLGPISFSHDAGITNLSAPAEYDSATGEICFTASAGGSYSFIITVEDSCGQVGSDTTNVTVVGHTNPTISLGNDRNLDLCVSQEICVDVVTASEIFDLVTNIGSYNSQTGQICFTPESAGQYQLVAELTDTCGFKAYDTVNFDISLNTAPVIVDLPDKDFYLCYPQYVCLPLVFDDFEGNIASITTSQGYYNDGNICFLPRAYGTYEVVVTVVDSCGLSDVDTAVVTVQTDQDVNISVPNDTTVFFCAPDTLCFPVSGIPEWAEVTVNGINTWYDAANQTVCYYSDCGTTNHISISAVTDCGEYSASFTVVAICNSRPLVILPPDESVTLCQADSVCIPVGISDADDNITSIEVTGGTYDPVFGQVCLYAEAPGQYTITVTATDSCGLVDSDVTTIDIFFNNAPQITSYPIDSSVVNCQLDSICLPFTYLDIDGNIADITSSVGVVDPEMGYLCFLPDSAGYYCIDLTVTDSCGLTDMVTICVTVDQLSSAYVACADSTVFLCGGGEVCVPVQVTGNYNSVSTNIGQYSNGEVCFSVDTAGIYELMVITTADCNVDTCVSQITVSVGTSVAVGCPSDTAVILCGPDTLDFDLNLEGSYDSLKISDPAFVDGDFIRVPITSSGVVSVSLIAYSTCGVDSCSFEINTTMNSKPSVNAGADFEQITCLLEEICFPISLFDINGNLDTVYSSVGSLQDDSTICFTPGSFGVNTVILTVQDSCGATDKDTINITVTHGGNAAVFCPQNEQFASLCGPDYVCVPVSVTPASASVTVLPSGFYDSETGEVCVYVENGGITVVTVIAETMCSADTCSFNINTTFKELAAVTCPEPLSIMTCIDLTDSLRIPIVVSGTGVSVNINPVGSYSAGLLSFPVDSAGVYQFEVIVYNDCNADTCLAIVNVLENQAPSLTLPSDTTIYRCPTDTELICIEGILGSDSRDTVLLSQTCGIGAFESTGIGSGKICFRPDSTGLYEFCIEASDRCSSTSGSFFVTVEERLDCDVCVRVSIDGGSCVPVGIVQNVDINVQTNTPIGGFELLIGFDASVTSFRSAVIVGGAIDGWEYFTYRIIDNGSCGGACPGGMLRLVGIADANNGNLHPPAETLEPDGRLVRLQFQIANNQNLGDQFLPISFFWFDCTDNTFSSVTGDDLYLDRRIRNSEGLIIWDESIDQIYPENSRPFGLGAPDSCIGGDKPSTPIRCVEFINGGICVVHPDTIDDRGDINLNEVPYEIADAVLFSNYFVYGLSVFTKNPAGQTAASDVNADGLTLTVADLVQLIRVIVGDANPIPKPVVPYEERLIVSDELINGTLSVKTDAVSTIGAAHLIYTIEGDVEIKRVTSGRDAQEMMFGYHVLDNQLRMLIYDIGGHSIAAGKRDLVQIEYSGDGSLSLLHSDFVDYQARPYETLYKGPAVPRSFELKQNYPNPFNPVTTISFSLPERSDWTVEIFNITGSQVRKFDGTSNAGRVSFDWNGTNSSGGAVASGIYFYRLKAAEFSDTKKMVLLK